MSSLEFETAESRPASGDPNQRGSRRAGIRVRARTLVVTIGGVAIAATVAIVGFGSLAGAGDTSGAGTSGSSTAAAHSFSQLTTDQKTCLKNALGDLVPAAGSTLTMPTHDQIQNAISRVKGAMTSCGITVPAGVPGKI
jgi:hypothetical protein